MLESTILMINRISFLSNSNSYSLRHYLNIFAISQSFKNHQVLQKKTRIALCLWQLQFCQMSRNGTHQKHQLPILLMKKLWQIETLQPITQQVNLVMRMIRRSIFLKFAKLKLKKMRKLDSRKTISKKNAKLQMRVSQKKIMPCTRQLLTTAGDTLSTKITCSC